VRAAVENGAMPPERLANYHKLRGELLHLEAKQDDRARAERRRQERAFHRTVHKHIKHKRL
jgi:hypothetical protein